MYIMHLFGVNAFSRSHLKLFTLSILKSIFVLTFVSYTNDLVVVTLGDVCFYEDGSRYGRTILCTGTCCGTGEDPCCV
jgi:hypothetical protein